MKGGRILALDYGSRRIGLALSDPTGLISTGAGVLTNDRNTHERLGRIVEDRDIRRIVVGMPYRADGSTGEKGREISDFVEALGKIVSVPIELWDESFTTVGAQRIFIETGMKKKKRREKGRRDEMAARLLLQEYLDAGRGQLPA